ncbi:RNA polymerase sigma-70 factor [Bacteroides sp.]|uniref:RNA polymerase sigma-70 factor n=1 Tax=Bacteroides sp. TaxID=29523 RepID=UPI003AB51B75
MYKEGQAHIHYLLDRLALDDSETAFKAIYLAYYQKIIRYVQMFVKSREIREELVSDIFVSLWENRKKMPEVQSFDAYLFTIAKFKVFNYIRDTRKDTLMNWEELTLDLFYHTTTTPEDECITKETIQAVNKSIEELPSKTKMVFKLIREDGMKYKDVAAHLGVSINTVETQMKVAVKRILKAFEEFELYN